MTEVKNKTITPNSQDNDVIDLGKLFGILFESRWLIIAITTFFAIAGICYALMATPIYKADALIQVEDKNTGMPAIGEMSEFGGMFGNESSATTEIEIIKSRMVLGQTVDKLNLTTVIAPINMPIIGNGLARLQGIKQKLTVSTFELPEYSSAKGFILKVINAEEGSYQLIDEDEQVILSGHAGELVKEAGFSLFVQNIIAENDTEFTIAKISRLDAMTKLKKVLSISERGKQTGILELSLLGTDRADTARILDDISTNYFMQNVARNSAEAESSLQFLKEHLPDVHKQLSDSEDKLNEYQQKNESIDLTMEAQSTLDTLVALEQQLNVLTFKESDISQKFTKSHPAYKALIDKRNTLLNQKAELTARVEKLPTTQRDIVSMRRDVQVNQELYLQLLNKAQELNIVKASTVGNIRILDPAEAFTNAVKPKKSLIVILITMLGGMLAVALVLLRASLHRGVENPDEIEALGLSVYASVPLSNWQTNLNKRSKKKLKENIKDTLLAAANPADLSIESLRNLRTSLHFATMEAKNNILMFSGPSPAIGKSFIAANMASIIATANQRVLIIDADMRRGCLESEFASSSQPGLSNYLSGQGNIADVVKNIDIEGVDFIARGVVPPNPSELLTHPRLKELLEWSSEHYDTVIIDTPPILAVTDAAIIGQHVGTILMVARFDQSTLKEIELAAHRFEQGGMEIKGVVLNAVEKKSGSTYGYYNYNYQSQSD